MGSIWVKDVTGGLDTRRLAVSTAGGVLVKGVNGHINTGGEFEKRAAFVLAYDLPDGTVGLAHDNASLIVFGSSSDPGVPSGVGYQQLVKDSKVLSDVPSFDLFGDEVYAVGQFDDGTVVHYLDTVEVTDWFDGRARASFDVTGGTGSSTIDIKVNGVSILASAVSWGTSNEATAAAIAAAIESNTSSPNYSATAVGTRVNIIADDAGVAANGFAVTLILATGFATSPETGLALSGGADSDSYTPGSFVKTVGSKVYATSGPRMHFSGIREPAHWTSEYAGAGFVNVAQEASGANELLALADYQGLVAVFSERVVLTFYVDPDPDLVTKRQVLQNTGTVSPKSVTEFGDADVFYLALSGLRSLRARDSSNAAASTDLGSPVDADIKTKLSTMTTAERRNVAGLINPVDGRFWLCFPDGEIFVFSFFPSAKVSAWTTYDTGWPIDAVTVFDRRVYLRSGNSIYVYGGLDDATGLEYDSTVAKAWLPYFNAGRPAQKKSWNGLDAALEGVWRVYLAMDSRDISVRELAATLSATTFDDDRVPVEQNCTHLSPQFESYGDGPAVLSSAVLHYVGGEES